MKNMIIVTVLVPMLLLGADLERLSINVYGSANIDINADQVSIVFGIEDKGKSLDNAYAKMKQKVELTLDKLAKYGVSKEKVYVSDFKSGESYWGGSLFTKSDDFKASTTVTISDIPVDNIEKVILELARNEVEHILNVVYSSSKASETKVLAREKALQAAQAKAQEIANTMSIKVGPVTKVEEYRPSGFNDGSIVVAESAMMNNRYSKSFNTSVSIKDDSASEVSRFYPRKISIEQHVKVAFQIVQ